MKIKELKERLDAIEDENLEVGFRVKGQLITGQEKEPEQWLILASIDKGDIEWL